MCRNLNTGLVRWVNSHGPKKFQMGAYVPIVHWRARVMATLELRLQCRHLVQEQLLPSHECLHPSSVETEDDHEDGEKSQWLCLNWLPYPVGLVSEKAWCLAMRLMVQRMMIGCPPLKYFLNNCSLSAIKISTVIWSAMSNLLDDKAVEVLWSDDSRSGVNPLRRM